MLALTCILLIANTIIIYWAEKHISIALINSAMWAFLSSSVLLFKLPATEKAYIFVLFNTIVFTFFYLASKGNLRIKTRRNTNIEENENPVFGLTFDDSIYNKLIKWTIILNLLSVFYLAYSLGFRINTFTSIARLMSRMNAISSMRYTGDAEAMPLVNRLINAIVYSSCAFSGFYMAYRAKGIHLVNIVLIVFQTIILNTKATLVFGLAFWVGGYLTSISYQHKRISGRKAIIAVGSIIVVLFFSAGINYFRHSGRVPYFLEFQRIMNAYFIGPFSAFSIWLDSVDGSALDLGANTFSCIFRVFGIKAQEHGASMVLSDSAGTNVYTIFKHLVNDYSYLGTILISITIGFVSGIIDTHVRNGRYKSVNISMVFCAVILVSFFSSLFRYTTNLVACVIIILIPLLKRVTVGGKTIL